MKKLILIRLLFSTGIVGFFSAHSAEDLNVEGLLRFGQAILQPQEIGQPNQYYVTAQFKCEKFLEDYNNEYSATLGKVTVNDNDLTDACWKALFSLKDYYKERDDELNYGFTYLNMAKLLLTHQAYPKNYKTSYHKKKFHQELRNIIGRNVIPKCPKSGKLLKWTHIYEGMLFLDYVKQFPNTLRRDRCIADAYYEFCQAMQLKTTKTTYLLAAEVILDFGYVPKGMAEDEAKILAQNYLKMAFEKTRGAMAKNQDKQPQEELTTVEAHARPAYINEVTKKGSSSVNQSINENGTSPSMEKEEDLLFNQSPMESGTNNYLVGEDEEESPEYNTLPVDSSLEQDQLENYDYGNLIIPRRQSYVDLPIRSKAQNIVGSPQEFYTIDNKRFRRQNVSGQGMRCFFNSVGLNSVGQVHLLDFLRDDPILRYMIANEIVSSARTSEQIPDQVKQAINYDLYAMQQGTLDRLNEERNSLLSRQNTDSELTNPMLLPQIYQQLDERGSDYLEQLRQRALRLPAYKAFLNYHIGNGEMMVVLIDLQGNGNANFTSIDAIAYANNLGIKVYQPFPEDSLRLVHQYIPQDAEELVYIYHSGVHFQALVPVEEDEKPDAGNLMDISQDDDKDESDLSQGEGVLEKMPNNNELERLYPDLETTVHQHKYNTDLVRKIIHMSVVFKMKYKEIAEILDMDQRRISEILLQNNIRRAHYLPKKDIEDLAHSYLELYQDIQCGKVRYIDIAKEFIKRVKVPLKTITQYFSFYFREEQNEETFDLIKEQLHNVIDMYKNGRGFYEIKEQTGLSIETIIKLIHEKVTPENYVRSINLQVKKNVLSEGDKKELIIKTFKDQLKIFTQQQKKNPHAKLNPPSVSSVQKALASQGIGYKPVERVLKKEGLVKENIKAAHLTKDQKEKIKNEFAKINPPQGKIVETYNKLAKKFNVTKVQVIDLLKNRTYESQRKQDIQANYDKVVAAYHKLTPEQQRRPASHIAKTVALKNAAIRDILEKAGLYKRSGGSGKAAYNVLAGNEFLENRTISNARKRGRSEMERTSSSTDSSSDEGSPDTPKKESSAKRRKR